jgi:hypothetical protein
VTARDIRRAARILAEHGLDSDSATTADLMAAAGRHLNRREQDAIRRELDTIGGRR